MARSPFLYFKTSTKIIQLGALMTYVVNKIRPRKSEAMRRVNQRRCYLYDVFEYQR
jgi:hypothetical protein